MQVDVRNGNLTATRLYSFGAEEGSWTHLEPLLCHLDDTRWEFAWEDILSNDSTDVTYLFPIAKSRYATFATGAPQFNYTAVGPTLIGAFRKKEAGNGPRGSLLYLRVAGQHSGSGMLSLAFQHNATSPVTCKSLKGLM